MNPKKNIMNIRHNHTEPIKHPLPFPPHLLLQDSQLLKLLGVVDGVQEDWDLHLAGGLQTGGAGGFCWGERFLKFLVIFGGFWWLFGDFWDFWWFLVIFGEDLLEIRVDFLMLYMVMRWLLLRSTIGISSSLVMTSNAFWENNTLGAKHDLQIGEQS